MNNFQVDIFIHLRKCFSINLSNKIHGKAENKSNTMKNDFAMEIIKIFFVKVIKMINNMHQTFH